MTARAERLQSLEYNTESSWAEAVSTFGTRLQTIGGIELDLQREKLDINPTTQYQNEGVQHVPGVYGGGFRFSALATGALDAAGGASDLATLLGLVVGNSARSAGGADTAEDSGGSSATSLAVDAATGHADGGVCRVGALGDGGGEGMLAAVSGHATSTIDLLTALPAAPGDNDVIYDTELVYPYESDEGALSGMRFRFLSANKQYLMRGCFPRSLALSNTGPGGLPQWDFDFGASYWTETNTTFPSATATSAASGAPVSAGRFFYQDKGTATEQTDNIIDFSINFDLQVQPIQGPGGLNEGQVIIGAVRHKCMVTFTTTHNVPATGTDTFSDLWDGTTYQHVLYQMTNGDGKTLGLYFPNAAIVGVRPVQSPVDGLNRIQVQWAAHTDTSGSSELERSSWRAAMA